jgi:hypothetical protein
MLVSVPWKPVYFIILTGIPVWKKNLLDELLPGGCWNIHGYWT